MKKNIVFITGAGISAESGIPTFRDKRGFWKTYPPEIFALAASFETRLEEMLAMYNSLKEICDTAQPNPAHLAIAKLESEQGVDVKIVTMNIDNLHQRAGSKKVVHIHGQLAETVCTDFSCAYRAATTKKWAIGDTCSQGHQVRPAVVCFDEFVENYSAGNLAVAMADAVVVVGTSGSLGHDVGFLNVVRKDAKLYVVDPEPSDAFQFHRRAKEIHFVEKPASIGVLEVIHNKLF